MTTSAPHYCVLIDSSRITLNAAYERSGADPSLQSLIESIRQRGQVTPCVVRKLGAGYELLLGYRRFRALQVLHPDGFQLLTDIYEADDLQAALINSRGPRARSL